MTWDEIYSKARKTVSKAADKLNQATDLATLQVKLSLSERKLDEEYAALGKIAYRHFVEEKSSAEEVASAIASVQAAQLEVDDYKKQIIAMQKKSPEQNPPRD